MLFDCDFAIQATASKEKNTINRWEVHFVLSKYPGECFQVYQLELPGLTRPKSGLLPYARPGAYSDTP